MRYKKPIIAIAPIRYFDVHKTHNLVKIKKYISLAKKKKADIICFPESCLSKKSCLHLTHSMINSIRQECQKQSIWCIITDDVQIGRRKYNVSLIIDRQGKIQGTYRKIHLYGDRVRAGSKIKVFKTDFGKIGVAICWDLSYPNLFEKMRKKGAEIIFCPSLWEYDIQSHPRQHKQREINLLRAMILTRAFENICFIALCNPLTKSQYQVSYSAIAGPHKILKELINKEGLLTAKVSIDELKKFRKFYAKEPKKARIFGLFKRKV